MQWCKLCQGLFRAFSIIKERDVDLSIQGVSKARDYSQRCAQLGEPTHAIFKGCGLFSVNYQFILNNLRTPINYELICSLTLEQKRKGCLEALVYSEHLVTLALLVTGDPE